MLRDGRLHGVKVGGQWRFDPVELERITAAPAVETSLTFPVHCAQTIQNLLTGVSEMSAVIVDTNGRLITRPSGQRETALRFEKPEFEVAWKKFSASKDHAGLEYPPSVHHAAAGIHAQGRVIAWVLLGSVLRADRKPQPNLEERYPLVNAETWKKMYHWAQITAQAVESILSERSGFLVRLQRISDLTQVS